MPKNDWNEYKKLLIHEMTENASFRKTVSEALTKLSEDVSGLKVKAAIAGGAAGIVGTGLMTAVLSAWK